MLSVGVHTDTAPWLIWLLVTSLVVTGLVGGWLVAGRGLIRVVGSVGLLVLAVASACLGVAYGIAHGGDMTRTAGLRAYAVRVDDVHAAAASQAGWVFQSGDGTYETYLDRNGARHSLCTTKVTDWTTVAARAVITCTSTN